MSVAWCPKGNCKGLFIFAPHFSVREHSSLADKPPLVPTPRRFPSSPSELLQRLCSSSTHRKTRNPRLIRPLGSISLPLREVQCLPNSQEVQRSRPGAAAAGTEYPGLIESGLRAGRGEGKKGRVEESHTLCIMQPVHYATCALLIFPR